jgi:hypothetical protein
VQVTFVASSCFITTPAITKGLSRFSYLAREMALIICVITRNLQPFDCCGRIFPSVVDNTTPVHLDYPDPPHIEPCCLQGISLYAVDHKTVVTDIPV